MNEKVLLHKAGHVAVMTLNMPESLNALNTEFMGLMNGRLDEIVSDSSIYVLVITSIGKGFIAGADIKEMVNLNAVEMLEWAQIGSGLNTRIENLSIPVIAAINGFCLGGGCELAMACDIRIASAKAKFGQPEVGIGVTPGAGGTQRLPRIVGEAKAKELLYTGIMIDANEAERIGLVNRVVVADELMTEVMKLAELIAIQGQIAVKQCKKTVNAGLQADINTGLALELQAFSLCSATEDKKIGMSAFINKEKVKNFINK